MAASEPAGDRSDRFLLDVMCGTLTSYLRMCGYDTAYAGDLGVENDDRLRSVAREEGRTLVTRDVSLAGRAESAVLLTAHGTVEQLRELRGAGVRLELAEQPSRCGRCNGAVEPVPAGADRPEYAPSADEFDCWRCVECGQFFWKGSHWKRVEKTINEL